MKQKDLHLIVGLGETGLSCARYLSAHQIPFALTDTRAEPPLLKQVEKMYPHAEIALGGLNANLIRSAAKIILSPGVPKSTPLIAAEMQNGKPVCSDIELFARAVSAPVIAITGTNAKSTVTTLVGEMVQACGLHAGIGGNLGVPALDLLQNARADCFVLELSSFQLETTYSLKPRVATVLNITPDHMDRYDTFQEYQQTKHRVYHHAEAVVCNGDDPLTDTDIKPKFYFSLKNDSPDFHLLELSGTTFLSYQNQTLLPITELPITGQHYQANALAALAIGHAYGLPISPMLNVLRTFKGLPHRCQFVRELNQVKWYNDSKGTNVGATIAAIQGLGKTMKGKLILIAGGVGKNAEFSPLTPILEKYCRQVILIGEAAPVIERILPEHMPYHHADSFAAAVKLAAQSAQEGDSVLLSPACASFDMFQNFAHRGEEFIKLVNAL